jgi:hypothetical protein
MKCPIWPENYLHIGYKSRKNIGRTKNLQRFDPLVMPQIKVEVKKLLKVGFIRMARCLDALGIYEWIVMSFKLKNDGVSYQGAMDVIWRCTLMISW